MVNKALRMSRGWLRHRVAESLTYCHAFSRCCLKAVSVGRRVDQPSAQITPRCPSASIVPVRRIVRVRRRGGGTEEGRGRNSLAGLRLFFFSLVLLPESWDAIESV